MDSLYKSCVWLATQARRDDLKWQNIAMIVFSHTTAVWGLFKYGGQVKLATILFAYVIGGIGGFGVTAGAHRLWTHRTYKAKWPLRVILLFCYSVAGQNSLFDWVRDHRVHHKFSDTDADPHNANRGFFFSHIGWLMCKKHPEVIAKGNQLDLSDLFADPLVKYYQKVFIYFRFFLCFIIPPCMATYLWGEDIIVSFITLSFIRYVLSLNFTFLVNSAAHLYGYKPYDTRIFPSQNKWVSMVAMGEGWHNYHHVFPWDYRAAEFGTYSLNITTLWLDLFAKIGWAYDMKKPSEKMVRAHAVKYAGVEHPHEINEEEAMELETEDDKMTAFDYIKNKPSLGDANGNVEDKSIEQISNVETIVKSKSVEENIHPTVQKRHIKNNNEISSDNNNSIETINDSDVNTKNKPVEQMNGFESIINNKTGDFINSFHTMMKNNPSVEPMSGFDSLIMNGGILIKDKAA